MQMNIFSMQKNVTMLLEGVLHLKGTMTLKLEGDDDFKAGTLEWQADKNLLEEVRPVDGISLNNCSRYLV